MDGSWTFTQDGDYLTATFDGEDYTGLSFVMSMLKAVGNYLGMEADVMTGYVNGLNFLGIENDNFVMEQDEATGTTTVHINDVETVKAEAEAQTTNGAAESATGTDLSGWVTIDDEGLVSFTLADGMAYRTSGAAKAVPGFDVIDYGQEDYVFGDSDTDARHWSEWVLKALQENRETLEELFVQQ